MALTDVAIKNAKAREKPYKMGDAGGLFLLVQPSGGKLWRLKYRVDGREKKLGIGTYPEVSLAEARKRRDDARELLAAGKDPSREKQRDKVRSRLQADNTFTAIAREFCDKRKRDGDNSACGHMGTPICLQDPSLQRSHTASGKHAARLVWGAHQFTPTLRPAD